MSKDTDAAQRRRVHAIIELEALKSSIAADQVGMAPEDRLILTLIMLDRMEDPATGLNYASITAQLDDILSESTVARRCKAMEKAGLIKRVPSGLMVVNPEPLYSTALNLYYLYRDKICEVERSISGGCGARENV